MYMMLLCDFFEELLPGSKVRKHPLFPDTEFQIVYSAAQSSLDVRHWINVYLSQLGVPERVDEDLCEEFEYEGKLYTLTVTHDHRIRTIIGNLKILKGA